MGRDTQPFPTSQQVYHRVRWDPRFDETRYHIGFVERSGRVKEKPLSAWNPHGDIPWHRVQYVRCEDTRVWDREARVDLIMSAAPPAPATQETAALEAVTLHTWHEGAWRARPPAMPAGGALRVVTWNLLTLEHDPELEPFETRAARAIGVLGGLDADVIFLQEADAFWLDALATTPWVRAGWSLSASPDHDTPLLQPHGILCLTRVFLELEVLHFQAPKHALLARTPELTLASVHLTSNRAHEAELKRRTQLSKVLSRTRDEEALVLLGDFNMRQPHEVHELLSPHDLSDVWLDLRADDPGLTYDPATNPLAGATSTTGLGARFDRVLLRGGRWHARHIDMVTSDASDHHALCVDLQSSATSHHAPSRDTALAILLPPEIAGRADALRVDHDPTYAQWPPHITVMYPFVSREALPEALEALKLAMEHQPALTLELASHSNFDHEATSTWWIKPEPLSGLRALRDAIARVFPAPASAAPSAEYHPHLTVAKTKGGASRALLEGLRAWEPSAMEVLEVAVLRRDEDGVVRVETTLPFGGEGVGRGWLRAEGALLDEDHAPLLQWLEDVVPVTCHATGSSRLGTELVGSDIDLVALTHTGEDDLARRLMEAARVNPALGSVRDAREALAPSIKFTWSGREVDVLITQVPEEVALGPALPYEDRERLGVAGRRALDTLATADALLDAVHAIGAVEAYQDATRLLKWTARRRHIHRSAWGYLGGISWSIAAARAALEVGSGGSALEIASHALELLATWSWPEPLTLRPGTPAEVGHRARVPIITPAAPFDDTAMRVTTATAAILIEEFERAASALPRWGEVLAPYEPERACLRLEVAGGPASWVDRDILTWVRDLQEASGAQVRPDPVTIAKNTWRIEVLEGKVREATARAMSERWTHGWRAREGGEEAHITLA